MPESASRGGRGCLVWGVADLVGVGVSGPLVWGGVSGQGGGVSGPVGDVCLVRGGGVPTLGGCLVWGGGRPGQGGEVSGPMVQGVCLVGVVCLVQVGGCAWSWGVVCLVWGVVCLVQGGCVPGLGGSASVPCGIPSPPVNRMTNRC